MRACHNGFFEAGFFKAGFFEGKIVRFNQKTIGNFVISLTQMMFRFMAH